MIRDHPPRFDPYQAWLNVEETRRPLNAYQLLGLKPLEEDAQAIRAAAQQQRAALEHCRRSSPPDVWQQVYQEVDDAARLLLDPDRKAVYDQTLQGSERDTVVAAVGDTGRIATRICGQCQGSNLAVRQFCAHCGSPLWETCPQCGTLCGQGERFCGACGANLLAAVEDDAQRCRAGLDEAQRLAGDGRYDEAIAILEGVARSRQGSLHRYAREADDRIRELAAKRERLQASAAAAVQEARGYDGQHQYERAIQVLEAVWGGTAVPEVTEMLADLRGKVNEVSVLEAALRNGLAKGGFSDAVQKVGRLLTLKPDHAAAKELSRRLVARLAQAAQAKLDAFDYEAAWRLLHDIPEGLPVGEGLEALRERAGELAALDRDLRSAPVASPALLSVARRLVEISPKDPKAARFHQELTRRVSIAGKEPGRGPIPWTPAPANPRLGCPVEWATSLRRLTPAEGLDFSAFYAHPGSYWVAYGLALQGLKQGVLKADLFPSDQLGMLQRMSQMVRSRMFSGAWGIDLGSTALKAIRLQPGPDGALSLAACDFQRHRKPLGQAVNKSEEQTLVEETIGAFLARNDLKGSRVCVSLPGLSVLSRQIQLPPMPEAKLPSAIEFEIKQQMPCPMDDLLWDFDILNAAEDGSLPPEQLEILVLAAKRDLATPMLDRVRQAGLQVDSLQSEAIALYQALAHEHFPVEPRAEKAKEGGAAVALLDVGGDQTNLVIGAPGRIWFRSLGFGSHTLSKALVREFQITFAEAERWKFDPASAQRFDRIRDAVELVLQSLDNDIQQGIASFTRAHPGRRLERILGAGGGFQFHGLWSHLRAASPL